MAQKENYRKWIAVKIKRRVKFSILLIHFKDQFISNVAFLKDTRQIEKKHITVFTWLLFC